MKLSKLVILLASFGACAAAYGQALSNEPAAQDIVATTFCAKSGSLKIATGTMRCNGAWTLTLQPSRGVAAHLVGGMSPIEVRAVLDATGVAYTSSDKGTLKAGKLELQFGEQGLEAFASSPSRSTTGT